MAPPPGQTNRDTSAADHTTCFYCHQQLILVSHKVIVSRDAHGCSIRICEPCEKEARRRRPGRPFFLRSRRRRTVTRSLPPHRSRSRRKMRVLRPCASSWAAPRTRRRKRVINQLCLNLTCSLAHEIADPGKLFRDQRRAAYEAAVDVRLRHELVDGLGRHGAAVLDAHGVRRRPIIQLG